MEYFIQNYNIKKKYSNSHDIQFTSNCEGLRGCNYGWNFAEHSFIKYLENLNNLEWVDSTVGTSEGNVINSEIRSSKKLPFKTSITKSHYKDTFKINDIIKDKLFNKNPSFLEDTLYYDNNFDLLKYEEGDFFAKHTDGDSELNHFGTLLILPPKEYSTYEGGELILYDGEEEIKIISDQNYWIIIGFNTEIPHELKPITSGTRYAYKSKIILPSDTNKIITIYNKNNIEYTAEEIKVPNDDNYILTNINLINTNQPCINQIHNSIKRLNMKINELEKKKEDYKNKIKSFEDPEYHQFEDEIVGYMQEKNKGKFIIICEHYYNFPEPKKLHGNDRKIFDKLIQNYDVDVIILKASVSYTEAYSIDYINIDNKIEKLLGNFHWKDNIKQFNINSNLKEKYSIGGKYCGGEEEYNDEYYFTRYTNKVTLMLVSFRI